MVVLAGDIEGGAYAGGAYAGGGADGCGGCGAVCFEPEGIETKERWVYKGAGMGSYSQVGNMEMLGAGRGDFEKERYAVASGTRLRFACIGAVCVAFFILIALTVWWAIPPAADVSDDVMPVPPAPRPEQVVVHDKYYTQVRDVKVPHMVPVPLPPPPRKVITHHVTVHTTAFDCSEGSGDWKHTWSGPHQRYCCYKNGIACTTKITYRPHYHTITHIKHVTVPVPVPIPAPPAQVVNHVVNTPIHDPPQVIKVPVPGQPNVVPKYVHQKHYVPVPEPSPPQYHTVKVPYKVKDPGEVIKVPVPLPPQTVVKNKVIYKTRHVKVKHIYDCKAGFANWNAGWSSAKKGWCCSHEQVACPGDHSGQLTKTYVTHVTQHMGPEYTSHYHSSHAEAPVVVHHVHHYHYTHADHGYTPPYADSDADTEAGTDTDGDSGSEFDGDNTETHVVHHYGGFGGGGDESSEDGGSFSGGGGSFSSGGGSFNSGGSFGGSGSFHHSSSSGSFGSGGGSFSGGSGSFHHSSGSFSSGGGSFHHSSSHHSWSGSGSVSGSMDDH